MSYSFSEDEDAYIPTPEDAPYFSLVGNIIVQEYPENPESKEQLSDFENKLKLYDSLNHKNILSVNGGRKSSVHEGIESLEKHLTADSTLSWMQRLQICVDVADALRYLHFDLKDDSSVIHGNVNSSVILLNKDNFTPILHGFRYAVKVKRHSRYISRKYYGSLQYKDPAFESTGGLTHKSDVYSFGVVLFEVLFGLNASVHEDDNRSFAQMARHYYDEKRLDEKINDDLRKQMDDQSLHLFSQTAYFCLEEQQAKRPDMEQVFKRLKKALELHQSFVHPTAPNRLKVENMNHLKEALDYQKINEDSLHISLEEIKLGTQDFNDHNCIEKEGYWKQYVGKITHDNKHITVIAKRWNRNFPQFHHQFFRELKVLHEYKHENLVSLVGYCNENDEKIIVYEYPRNGSLAMHLDNASLTWVRRLKICIDVATGLDFLHTKVAMMHTNIKSASILLDGDWKAKISNLELSAHLSDVKPIEDVTSDDAYSILPKIYHFMHPFSPYDIEQGYMTRDTDIYSLGVVLKEFWFKRMIDDPSMRELTDIYIEDESFLGMEIFDVQHYGMYKKSTKLFKAVVSECSSREPQERPNASYVVTHLKNALKVQEDYEEWKPKLPKDYKDIIKLSTSPDTYNSIEMFKDLYDTFSKGILLKDGKVLFSLASNGERNEMISARMFSYKNGNPHDNWCIFPQSRFEKVAHIELDAIYVEGIEFRPIDNGGHQETKTSKEIEQVLKSNSNFDSVLISSEMILKGSINNDSGQELFSLTEVEGKKHIMLSAMAVVCNHSDSTLFDSKPSLESRFEKGSRNTT
ncbi:hypothetical protein QVD17_07824 [Tagetes erecta]|uniref:Protein kinase domain-containing protein n=1 Tax=Tagetes erecta TaxID=13708 RepID=A0AAD8L3N8_TARER|nr:hypothetical protein QVD17_07824 [Tagetes erecta]